MASAKYGTTRINEIFDALSISANIVISNFGATPGVVYLRLTQSSGGTFRSEKIVL